MCTRTPIWQGAGLFELALERPQRLFFGRGHRPDVHCGFEGVSVKRAKTASAPEPSQISESLRLFRRFVRAGGKKTASIRFVTHHNSAPEDALDGSGSVCR